MAQGNLDFYHWNSHPLPKASLLTVANNDLENIDKNIF